MVSSDKKNDLEKFITKDINLRLTRIAGTMLPSVTGITLESLLCRSKLLLQTTRGNVCSRKKEIGMVCFLFQNNETEIFVWLTPFRTLKSLEVK
jgi:hypothetical protein